LTIEAHSSRDERPTGRRRLFVYYRVGAAQAGAAIAAATRTQARLCERHAGLRAELMRRPEVSDALITLMETYACDAAISADGVDAALQRDIEAEASLSMAPWTVGMRHAEVFDACA